MYEYKALAFESADELEKALNVYAHQGFDPIISTRGDCTNAFFIILRRKAV